MLAIIEVWISDENAIVREKFRRGRGRALTPLLAAIVEPGHRDEGAFGDRSPEHAARVLVSLIQGANERPPSCTSPARPARSRSTTSSRASPPTGEPSSGSSGLPARLASPSSTAATLPWFG